MCVSVNEISLEEARLQRTLKARLAGRCLLQHSFILDVVIFISLATLLLWGESLGSADIFGGSKLNAVGGGALGK